VRGLFCFLTAGQALDRFLGEPFIRHRTYDNGRELPCPVDQPGAACLLVRRDDFDRLGGFDPATFLFFADTDLCRRLAEEGLEVHVDWDSHVVHTGGASVSRLDRDDVREHVQRDYLTYAQRHYPLLARWVTRAAVAVLTGLLPASWHLLRRGPASARQQLCVTVRVLRRSGSRS